jgi:hypothetical protein
MAVLSHSASITTAPRAFSACQARYGLRSKSNGKRYSAVFKAGKDRNVMVTFSGSLTEWHSALGPPLPHGEAIVRPPARQRVPG